MLQGTLCFFFLPTLTLGKNFEKVFNFANMRNCFEFSAVNIVRDGYFKPAKGEKIAELKNWGETFHIEFFIDFHEMDFSGWVNIMHFTTGLSNFFNTP